MPGEMQGRLTIQDIARLAGVSKATVSRVLNRNPSVDPVLGERVMRVVQEYNFVPNITATVLAGGRTQLIGVLAPPLNWPAMPEIMRGVAEYLEDSPYEIVLYCIGNQRNHADVLNRILAMRMISGLLAIFPGGLARQLVAHFQQGLPLVMIDDQEEPAGTPWVGIDNLVSAYEATKHLLECGHTRIAHIQGPASYHCAAERYQGYCQALHDASITPDSNLLFHGNFKQSGGCHCASLLFARDRSTWPTAIFISNDEMAYGFLEVAQEQGVSIPEDIAVVGFDDYIISAHTSPPLTTIRQPFTDIGRTAIDLLLTMIDRKNEKQPPKNGRQTSGGAPTQDYFADPPCIQLATTLVQRASSRVLNQQPISSP
ncbi:LacI family DNA-binding transcriptional regulator [Dictyobacter formicarum]|uniref:LacI family transcriptional regulator n=1 Tax=Dictyobacter formicarum TaxID=2778368 RepID=A0ABQ3VJB1_9CHLR|nr:LacI family DNA-binding transcriptional regulator [Dictyobacter formicarum]GHO85746.1 LacI family transcriptional regulator [Dictyobacter formicarum]